MIASDRNFPGQSFINFALAEDALRKLSQKLPSTNACVPPVPFHWLSPVLQSDVANPPHVQGFEEPVSQPDGLTITLHKYQLCALRWMLSVENGGQVGVKYSSLYPARSIRSDLLADFKRQVRISLHYEHSIF